MTYVRKGCALLLLVVVLVFAHGLSFAADAQTNLSVSSVSGVSGGQISVDININENSGMIAGAFVLDYDATKLTPKSISKGAVISDFTLIPNLSFSAGKIKVAWLGGVNAANAAGTVCTITFDIKSDATSGTVNLPLSEVKLNNLNNQTIPCNFSSGNVTIVGSQTATVLSASATSGLIGGQASIDININENSGMIAGGFVLDYDASKLTPKSITKGTVISDFSFIPNLAFAAGKIKVAWLGGVNPANTAGKICTIIFDIKSDAAAGTVNLPLSEVSLKNLNNQTIQCTTTSGSVIVSATLLKYGDVNGDGIISMADCSIVKQYILGQIKSFQNKDGKALADVDGDGLVTSKDYALIRKFVLGKISKFPIQ